MLRLAPAALGVMAAVLAAVGAEEAAIVVLVLGVPVAAAAGLREVARMVDEEGSWVSLVPGAVSLLLLVLAAAARRPELALGCAVVLALERLRVVAWGRLPTAAGNR